MEARAQARFARHTPMKARRVVDLIRGLPASQAQADAQQDVRRRARALLEHLTERELDVVVCLGRGLTNAQIADELTLSLATVKGYVSRVMLKVACENRTQVGLVAYDAGLVER